MIELSKTDTSQLCRYLKDAAAFYRKHAASIREQDRSRLLLRFLHKIERKIHKANQ